MRRIKLFGACILLILAAVPLLPGRGSLVIAEAFAVLEGEFAWVRRLVDVLDGVHRSPARGARSAYRHAIVKRQI